MAMSVLTFMFDAWDWHTAIWFMSCSCDLVSFGHKNDSPANSSSHQPKAIWSFKCLTHLKSNITKPSSPRLVSLAVLPRTPWWLQVLPDGACTGTPLDLRGSRSWIMTSFSKTLLLWVDYRWGPHGSSQEKKSLGFQERKPSSTSGIFPGRMG